MKKFLVFILSVIVFGILAPCHTLQALGNPFAGMGGMEDLFGDPGEEAEFMKFLQDQGIYDEVQEASYRAPAPSKKPSTEKKETSPEKDIDDRTLFLTPPSEGEKDRENVVLSTRMRKVASAYSTELIKQINKVENSIKAGKLGVDIKPLDQHMAPLEKIEPALEHIKNDEEIIKTTE